jgi:hypothetical protein
MPKEKKFLKEMKKLPVETNYSHEFKTLLEENNNLKNEVEQIKCASRNAVLADLWNCQKENKKLIAQVSALKHTISEMMKGKTPAQVFKEEICYDWKQLKKQEEALPKLLIEYSAYCKILKNCNVCTEQKRAIGFLKQREKT